MRTISLMIVSLSLLVAGGFQKPAVSGPAQVDGGRCSVANTASNVNIKIECNGVSSAQAQKLVNLLNEVAKDNSKIDQSLDSIQTFLHTQIPQLHSVLKPGSDPLNLGACEQYHGPGGSEGPFSGNIVIVANSAMLFSSNEYAPIIIRSKPAIEVSVKNGELRVSASVFSSDHRIIAKVEENKVDVNSNNYFKVGDSDDSHTFQVIDQYDKEVLYVHFANPHEIYIRGIFGFQGERWVEVTNDRIVSGEGETSGNAYSGACIETLSGGINFE